MICSNISKSHSTIKLLTVIESGKLKNISACNDNVALTETDYTHLRGYHLAHIDYSLSISVIVPIYRHQYTHNLPAEIVYCLS